MNGEISEIIADEKTLEEIASRIASEINRDYQDKPLLVVGILKGCVPFLADVFRRLTVRDCRLDFMAVSSYGAGSVSSGKVNIIKDISSDLSGWHVLIVEDILDTGNTLYRLKELLQDRNALSVKICTLLDKPARRLKPVTPDYLGMTVDDLFLVGYGLDYAERFRNLPYIVVLKPEIDS